MAVGDLKLTMAISIDQAQLHSLVPLLSGLLKPRAEISVISNTLYSGCIPRALMRLFIYASCACITGFSFRNQCLRTTLSNNIRRIERSIN